MLEATVVVLEENEPVEVTPTTEADVDTEDVDATELPVDSDVETPTELLSPELVLLDVAVLTVALVDDNDDDTEDVVEVLATVADVEAALVDIADVTADDEELLLVTVWALELELVEAAVPDDMPAEAPSAHTPSSQC